jgi:hypothetical protein
MCRCYAMLPAASPPASADLPARLGRPSPATVALSWAVLAPRIAPVYVAFWIG